MRYFNGFCFQSEEELFESFTLKSEFCFSAFSYGAIKLFKFLETYEKRVDTIQLFSPAFFQNKDEKFKKLQLRAFEKNRDLYVANFMKNVAFPSEIDLKKFLHVEGKKELEELLFYEYSKEQLSALVNKGVKIEVYLGELDKIVDADASKEFFLPFSTTFYFKDAGHILQ